MRIRLWQKKSEQFEVRRLDNGEVLVIFVIGKFWSTELESHPFGRYIPDLGWGCWDYRELGSSKIFLGNIYYKKIKKNIWDRSALPEEKDQLLIYLIMETIRHENLHQLFDNADPTCLDLYATDKGSEYQEDLINDLTCSKEAELFEEDI